MTDTQRPACLEADNKKDQSQWIPEQIFLYVQIVIVPLYPIWLPLTGFTLWGSPQNPQFCSKGPVATMNLVLVLFPFETQLWKEADRVSVTDQKNICCYGWKHYTIEDKIQAILIFLTSNTARTWSCLFCSCPSTPLKTCPSNNPRSALCLRVGPHSSSYSLESQIQTHPFLPFLLDLNLTWESPVIISIENPQRIYACWFSELFHFRWA